MNGTDRVELNGPERREFERQYRHALRGRIELEGLTFPPTPQLLRCVESIVAARVQALTAELDQLKEEVSEYVFEYIPLIAGQRDKAEADLDAARAEAAELRKSLDYWVELWKKAANDA